MKGQESLVYTLAKLVDLPTPLTPQNTIVNGLPLLFALCMSRRISIFFLGERIWTKDSSMLPRTAEATPEERFANYIRKIKMSYHTGKGSNNRSSWTAFTRFFFEFD